MDPKQPLWLPRGSIRAILALAVVGTALAMFLLNREVPESLAVLGGSIVGYYFASRGKGDGPTG